MPILVFYILRHGRQIVVDGYDNIIGQYMQIVTLSLLLSTSPILHRYLLSVAEESI